MRYDRVLSRNSLNGNYSHVRASDGHIFDNYFDPEKQSGCYKNWAEMCYEKLKSISGDLRRLEQDSTDDKQTKLLAEAVNRSLSENDQVTPATVKLILETFFYKSAGEYRPPFRDLKSWDNIPPTDLIKKFYYQINHNDGSFRLLDVKPKIEYDNERNVIINDKIKLTPTGIENEWQLEDGSKFLVTEDFNFYRTEVTKKLKQLILETIPK